MRRRDITHPAMFHPASDFTHAIGAARRCARRGDFAGADKWMKYAERHQKLAAACIRLAEADVTLRTYRDEQVAFRKWLKREDEAEGEMVRAQAGAPQS